MIRQIQVSEFPKIYSIMAQSFPLDEYRGYAGQQALMNDPVYSIFAETDANGCVCAFIAIWDLEEFLFIEHLASLPQCRNMGLGSKLLQYVLEHHSKQACLEVELPDREIARRRIGFYERNGFHINPYDYCQPALSPNRSPVPLRIMTSGNTVDAETFSKIKDRLYRRVYRCN